MRRPPRIQENRVLGEKRTPPERARRSVPGHLRFVRELPCVAGAAGAYGRCNGPRQTAHVRNGTDGGTGLKPHDKWVLPLCALHHALQHCIGELTFWSRVGIDPVSLAEHLWRHSGDTDKAIRAIERARMTARLHQ